MERGAVVVEENGRLFLRLVLLDVAAGHEPGHKLDLLELWQETFFHRVVLQVIGPFPALLEAFVGVEINFVLIRKIVEE